MWSEAVTRMLVVAAPTVTLQAADLNKDLFDVAAALRAAVKGSQLRGLQAAYEANRPALDRLINSMSATYEMRTPERSAVCAVLSAYKTQ